MKSTGKNVIVIGGGASGLIAAGTAAHEGHQVVLLERNRDFGMKLLISGKGRCNLTNDTDIAGLEKNIASNPRFLRPAFHSFTPKDVIQFFEKRGVPCKTERGGRVFPVSDHADDIVRALVEFCRKNGVKFCLKTRVSQIYASDGKVTSVGTTTDTVYPADSVILCTGGASYPGTGSTGDGYRLAEALGHTIIPIRPSLVGLETSETWPVEAQGLTLKNVTLNAYLPGGKKVFSELGEMLFTPYGVSGPLTLSASRHVADQPGSRLKIDLKPGLNEALLDARILRDFEKHKRRNLARALEDLLPRLLIPVVIKLTGIPVDRQIPEVTREERRSLLRQLKALTLTVKQSRNINEAIITVGGVSTKEIEPRTMESRKIKGLFFSGEVIDVDAYTGGFNLQIAWSTGRLAGGLGFEPR